MSNEKFGKYRAIVAEVDDEEKRGRIKVLCPMLYGEDLSPYCEPCVRYAYEDGGDFVLPKKNDFVWIELENGDVEKPIYLGGLWSKEHTPIEDYSTAPEVRQIEFKGNKITMKDGFLKIHNTESNVIITLEKGKLTVETKGDAEYKVAGNMTLNVTGNFDVKAGGNITERAGGNHYSYGSQVHHN